MESAAPKTVNEEIGFLLRIMGDLGDMLRARLKKKKKLKLKVRNDIGKAYTAEDKERMLAEAANARSPHIYLAHVGSERWCSRCGASGAYLGTDQIREGLFDRGPQQDRGR
jgi:hypothetical protein